MEGKGARDRRDFTLTGQYSSVYWVATAIPGFTIYHFASISLLIS
jgi:hypothetical protein